MSARAKRIAAVVLVVLLVAGFSAASCASHIAPAVVPTRTSPAVEAVPGVRACWLEYATAFGFTASGILIHHPRGAVLIDAGQSRGFAGEIQTHTFSDWAYLTAVPGGLVPAVAAAEVVQRAGVDPQTLSLVIPTHVHSDHLGGLMDLPVVPVGLVRGEIDHLQRAGTSAPSHGPFNVIAAEALRLAPQIKELVLEDKAYETFASHLDLFGDGSIVVVPLGGHTPGSVGIFVNVQGHRLFAVGDALNTLAQMDGLRGKAPYLARTDADPERADGQVAQLAGLHAQLPALEFLPAHERRTWQAVFGTPGTCLGR